MATSLRPDRLKLAVFDMDGTIIDSQRMIVAAMVDGFADAGLPPPTREETLSIVGLSLPVAVARLAPGLTAAEVEHVVERYKQAFIRLRKETGGEAASPLYPGAKAALHRLAARDEVLMGVATGKAMRGLTHALAAHELAPLFQTLQTADGHPSKPHPAMLLDALAETGAEAEDAVMIGDTEFDVEMARAAGMTAIAVTWGYHPEARLRDAGAHHVIHGWDELDAALALVWGEV
ncbi:HAD-IA family hydrolase [Albimonas sp. CAU 1670]|uniref:HAD-IA family hydrolase n=1 Tax=Albimonas sp. CAU 1670 TaxID=3032599 RepID=UPI0023DBEE31|nr:HAD-IA family hydrolase [Albimonas sp. CAU 1670]MDF2234364.1 HAD-IA family hydrolase [Albimonas sp. CAU 1670]